VTSPRGGSQGKLPADDHGAVPGKVELLDPVGGEPVERDLAEPCGLTLDGVPQHDLDVEPVAVAERDVEPDHLPPAVQGLHAHRRLVRRRRRLVIDPPAEHKRPLMQHRLAFEQPPHRKGRELVVVGQEDRCAGVPMRLQVQVVEELGH
jgi:hypothetical protein